MSRFVRPSKYRHVFGQAAKKEYGVDNVKVSNSAWDTNLIAASGSFISINWNASGGGAFSILPLPSPFTPLPSSIPHKLPDIVPLARGHTAPVLDTAWSPHDDSLVASCGDDGNILFWKVDASSFEGWGLEKWVPHDFDPVFRINGSPKRVGQVVWHPTAKHVLASATGEHVVKLWDIAEPDEPRITLTGHTDTIQDLTFNTTGTLLATTCRDRKLRLFDPRASKDPVRITDGHAGIKGSRVVWMGETERIATTGFSRMSDRQVSIWETGALGNVKTTTIDQSSGVVMPFWSDNNILFLAGKGDGNIRYYEYESDSLYSLSEYQSSAPQRGMCFLPRRALNVSECEIARVYKVTGTLVEPIAFVVPRKSDTFQSDIFPPAPSIEPSLTAPEFFSGKSAPLKLVDLDSGAIISSTGSSSPPSAATTFIASPSSSSPAIAQIPASNSSPTISTPTKTMSAPAPAPVHTPTSPSTAAAASVPTPTLTPTLTKSESPVMERKQSEPALPIPAHESRVTSPTSAGAFGTPLPLSAGVGVGLVSPLSASGGAGEKMALAQENDRLARELRDAREQIRNLEVQVEALRANAQRAAKALLDA